MHLQRFMQVLCLALSATLIGALHDEDMCREPDLTTYAVGNCALLFCTSVISPRPLCRDQRGWDMVLALFFSICFFPLAGSQVLLMVRLFDFDIRRPDDCLPTISRPILDLILTMVLCWPVTIVNLWRVADGTPNQSDGAGGDASDEGQYEPPVPSDDLPI